MINPVTGHTLKQFDEDLATLRDLVLRMGGGVEEQLRSALAALEAGDPAAARRVIDGDLAIDRIELRADEEIAHLLARRTPLGIDLRMVLVLAKVVTDLERVGDEAKKIARRCVQLAEHDTGALPFLPALVATGRLAADQLRGALDALARLDLELATRTKRADKQLDAACERTLAEIVAHIRQQPDEAALGIEFAFATRALERIGDHAKNITQYMFFLVEGRDVRHRKAQRQGAPQL